MNKHGSVLAMITVMLGIEYWTVFAWGYHREATRVTEFGDHITLYIIVGILFVVFAVFSLIITRLEFVKSKFIDLEDSKALTMGLIGLMAASILVSGWMIVASIMPKLDFSEQF